MRNEWNLVLKEYFQTRLWEIKMERGYTQGDLAEILHMDRRTVADILRGKQSIGSLTTVLFFAYLSEDPDQEIQTIKRLFQEAVQNMDDKSVF